MHSDSYYLKVLSSYGRVEVDQLSVTIKIMAAIRKDEPEPIIVRLLQANGEVVCSELGCDEPTAIRNLYQSAQRVLMNYVDYVENNS